MKTLLKTALIITVLAAGLALTAGTAMAAPQANHPWDQVPAIDPSMLAELNEMDLALDDDYYVPPEEQVFPDGGDDECAGCGEDEFPDEGVEDGVDVIEPDDGGDEGVVEEEETPPIDQGSDSGKTDETPKPPAGKTDSGKKLPNTGTRLVIIGGIGLLAALTAYGASRAMKKRMR